MKNALKIDDWKKDKRRETDQNKPSDRVKIVSRDIKSRKSTESRLRDEKMNKTRVSDDTLDSNILKHKTGKKKKIRKSEIRSAQLSVTRH